MDLGIIQITSQVKNEERYALLKELCIPSCLEASDGKYVLVSPENEDLKQYVEGLGGQFARYDAWEKDMSHKWRCGMQFRSEAWVGFFADDTYPDKEWRYEMLTFLEEQRPGQYGFRLTDEAGNRHQFGEDWMQFPSRITGVTHRPLSYNIQTGEIEDSSTAYVANCVVHREVLSQVEPFGIFGSAPDVVWSMAIRSCGFPVGFNPKARAFHLGDREDNRK